MKHIDFIFVGRAKQSNCAALETHYHDKVVRYGDSAIIDVKDSSEKNIAIRRSKESQSILDKLAASDWLVLCDERGKRMDSLGFANTLATWRRDRQRVVFVVGGAFGVSPELAARANALLRLSDFTLPHELARVVLLEQVYRALTIHKGEKYHHE